jgi:hypothetical protein
LDHAIDFGSKYALPVAKRILGFGDYHIANQTKKNSLFEGGQYNFTKKRTVITHREFISDVVSSSNANTFAYNTYSINPG